MDRPEALDPAQSAEERPARVPRRYAGPPTPAAPQAPPKAAKTGQFRPDPAWNKLLLLVGAAAAVAALLVVPGIINPGGKNPVAAAAEATSHSPGVRMNMAVKVVGPEQLSMTGTGLLNGETNRVSMQLAASGGAAGAVSIDEVIDNGDLYISSPQLGSQLGSLGVSKPWLLIKAEVFGGLFQGGSNGVGAGMSANPAQQLDALEHASSSVTEVGHALLDGVETTHYTAVVDPRKVADELKSRVSGSFGDLIQRAANEVSNETADVWIDGQGLIRRYTAALTMPLLGNMSMSIDFADYGIHPDIQVPPSSEVYDVTPILQGALNQLNGG